MVFCLHFLYGHQKEVSMSLLRVSRKLQATGYQREERKEREERGERREVRGER